MRKSSGIWPGEGQSYVTDSTNLETEAVRNKIRLEFLPILKTVNPSILDTLQDTIRHLEDAYTLYNIAVEDLKARICRNNRIDIQALKTIPAARTILFELLSAYGFNSVQAEEVFDHLDGGSGKVYESHEFRLLRDRKTLVLSRKDEQYKCLCHGPSIGRMCESNTRPYVPHRRVHYDLAFYDTSKQGYGVHGPGQNRISHNGEVRARRRPFCPFRYDGAEIGKRLSDKLPEKSVRKRKAVSRMQRRANRLVGQRTERQPFPDR